MDKQEKLGYILQRLGSGNWKRSGSGYDIRCPNASAHKHGDSTFSAHIAIGDKQDLLCFCQRCGDITAALCDLIGERPDFLCSDRDPEGNVAEDPFYPVKKYYESKGKRFICVYSYDYGLFQDGLFKIRLFDEKESRKSFAWIRKDGAAKSGFSFGRGDCSHRLFVAGNLSDDKIFLLEGEKDCQNLNQATGWTAVSPENGATAGRSGEKWRREYTDQLRGKTVFIIPDNDVPGKAFAETEKRELEAVAESVHVLDLASVWSEVPEGGDVSDLIESLGHDEAVKRLQTLLGTAGQAEEKKPDVLSLVPMSQIEEKSAKWCVPGYIPEGCITVIGGSGGIGKTSVVCQLVASVTTGKPCSIFAEGIKKEGLDYPETEPGTCVFLTAEDDLGITLRKRLRLAGADLDRVFSMHLGDDRFKMLKINTDLMDAVMDRYRPTVLIIDPLQGFLAEEVRMESRNMMRTALASVAKYGEKYGTTVIIIAHSNKRSESAGRQRLADSADLWDCARCVIMGGNTAIPGQFYLSVEKQNYGKILSTVLYKIDNSGIQFDGLSDLHDYDFATMKRKSRCKGSPQAEDAETLIEMFLKSGESKEIKDLDAYLTENGVSFGTAQRAKAHLKQQGNISRFCTGAKDNRKWFIRWIGNSVARNDDENLDFVDMDEDELFT